MRIVLNASLYRWIFFTCLILASYVFLQPPFEGFDENAHYSRVLDASEDLETQFSSGMKFDSRVLTYPGPVAYASGTPPFSGDKTYDRFYHQPTEALSKATAYSVRSTLGNRAEKENWQYQHPPLYYVLTGLFSRSISFANLIDEVIALRCFSVFLSAFALMICYKAIVNLSSKGLLNNALVSSAAGVFALCFPMFYFEFARIGNDALVFLCLSIAFYYSAKAYKSDTPQMSLMWMSLALTFGLWTKAVVLPLLPIFALYVLYCLWSTKARRGYTFFLRDFFWVYLVPIALGLAWYAFLYFKFHDLGLGTEARDLSQSTGLIGGLQANFSIANFLRGLMVPLASFIYAGSWSLVRAPIAIYLILACIYFVLIFRYVSAVIRLKDWALDLMPLALAASLYAGLAYHVLVSMALSGLGTSGGWYLYVLSPWLLMAICIAVDKMSNFVRMAMQYVGLLIATILFFTNVLIYSGFIIKGDDKAMHFPAEMPLELLQSVLFRLDYVSYPRVAFVLFFVGLLLGGYNLYKAR